MWLGGYVVSEQEQETGFHPLTTVAVTVQAFFFNGYWTVAGGKVGECGVLLSVAPFSSLLASLGRKLYSCPLEKQRSGTQGTF